MRAASVLAAAAVRAPGAAGDLRAVAAHLGGLRLAWLATAVAAQGVALADGTAAQRQLLVAGGARLRWQTVFGLVLASTGLQVTAHASGRRITLLASSGIVTPIDLPLRGYAGRAAT